MAKGSDPWEMAWMRCKESLDVIRGRLSGAPSRGSYIALGGDEEGGRSAELPLGENGATPSSLRARRHGAGWHAKGAARRAIMFMLPSFVAHALGHVDEDAPIPVVTTTSYLNGLRGLAAVIVSISHSTDDYPWVRQGWGQTPEDYSFVQLPFIRTLYAGFFTVSLFFVISGFALTGVPHYLLYVDNGLTPMRNASH
ncbi:hypothetical protein LZ30DRAFT_54541 [Colletotrichum cereale]|nr:hypothetical protein LZ30DRAFT_54541 [Colletotrichum cereale]